MAKKKTKKKQETPQAVAEWEETIDQMGEALASGSYMIAVWSLNGVQVKLFRKTKIFPTDYFARAMDLLEENLEEEKRRVDVLDAPATISRKTPGEHPEGSDGPGV